MNKDDMSKKRLAACAVFRELYESKKDIFGIIAEFLKSVIIENKKHTFDSTEITQFLRTTYGFDIPEAVINTSYKNSRSNHP